MFSSITLAGFLRAALVTQEDTVQYSRGITEVIGVKAQLHFTVVNQSCKSIIAFAIR